MPVSSARRSSWAPPTWAEFRTGKYNGLLVPAGAALYLSFFLFWGWIPHDEGTLAQTAERVLDGQLPHRDFTDPYTGGLDLFHALVFWLLGSKLTSLRIALFFLSVAFAYALYRVAVRLETPWVAAAVTGLCLAFSLPNYFAALPSWHLLFLATAGVLALMRFVETGKTSWLFLAGLSGGIGLTLKVVALYYVAAALLFLVFHEQIASRREEPRGGGRGAGWVVTVVAVVVLGGSLFLLLRGRLDARSFVYFVLPGCGVGWMLLGSEWRDGFGATMAGRLRGLIRTSVPFLLGCLLPIAVFLVPYLVRGDLRDLYDGALVIPRQRFERVTAGLPPLSHLFATIGPLVLLAASFLPLGRWRRPLAWLVAVLGLMLLIQADDPAVYTTIWESAYGAVPGLTLLAAWRLLAGGGAGDAERVRREYLFLLTAVLALMNLVQFPYSFGIYFYYVAPLLFLVAHAITTSAPRSEAMLRLPLWAFYGAFALLWLNPGNPRYTGVLYADRPANTRLDLPRAGLIVDREEVERYSAVVAEVQAHSAEGSFIYAAPDCPEVYFLSARKNPTRNLYDLFDDTTDRSRRILDLLQQRGVTVIVINLEPEFSDPVDPALLAALEQVFPSAKQFGNFIVAWRPP